MTLGSNKFLNFIGFTGLRRIPHFALMLVMALALVAPVETHAATAQLVKVNTGGEGARTRSVILGLNKAAVVELPVSARDVLVSDPAIVDAVVRTPRRNFMLPPSPLMHWAKRAFEWQYLRKYR